MNKLKPVASWCFQSWFDKSRWQSTSYMLASAKASLISIDQHLGRPRLYCDDLAAEIFCSLDLDLDYEIIYTDLFSRHRVGTQWWMYPKLLTYSQQQHPYFHFDLDFIIKKPWPDWVWDSQVGFQNFEIWNQSGKFYVQDPDSINLKLPDIFRQRTLSQQILPNVGYFYCKNMDFNKIYTDLALKIVQDNADIDHELYAGKELNCIAEQQLLGLLIRHHNIACRAFFADSVQWMNPYFNHFVGGAKNSPAADKYLDAYIDDKIKSAANYLDNLRKKVLAHDVRRYV